MVDVLDTKRAATRFRILVEIAERQPAVSQGEIAEAVGVTNQAVSEYIRELVEEGYVDMEARSHYRITKEGVDWLFRTADEVKRYADRVTEDVLGGLREDAAIATAAVEAGEEVTLRLDDGLLRADPDATGAATGRTTGAAAAGDDVGVTGFEGIIDLDPGHVDVVQVPSIRAGGSGQVDLDGLAGRCAGVDLTVCSGVEAVVAARRAGIEPDTWFGAGAVAGEAARRGLDVAVIVAADRVGAVTTALSDAGVSYAVVGAT